MKFDELDSRMRAFETAYDVCVPPGIYMVARIDGRNFTRLTKEVHSFAKPFDERMHTMMLETVRHLMSCGFDVVFGFTQSDEISLLFPRDTQIFERKLRKFNSILAGEASARFSLLLSAACAFDCRISALPTLDFVCDYFRWRVEDAHRNSLNAHCYWQSRGLGKNAREATQFLSKKSIAEKRSWLMQHQIDFDELPSWQKHGSALIWENYEKSGLNPLSGEQVTARRRRIVNCTLPEREALEDMIRELMEVSNSDEPI